MNRFHAGRFWRVIRNDALRLAMPVLYCTVVLLALTVLTYVSIFAAGNIMSPPASVVLFGIYLLGGGMVVAGAAFEDMHHPLARYRYLMLPCSNLERFLSRYLLTGPLFLLYVLASFSAIDWVANHLAGMWVGVREPPFAPFSAGSLLLARIFLFMHAVALTGAICQRSHSQLRTALAVLLGLAGLFATAYLAMRIFYWDHFAWTRFQPLRSLELQLLPLFAASWMNYLAVIGLLLWLLWLAYRCLRAHEVQGGL